MLIQGCGGGLHVETCALGMALIQGGNGSHSGWLAVVRSS